MIRKWEVKLDFMPDWVGQALLKGFVRPFTPKWWNDGLDVITTEGRDRALPGDWLVLTDGAIHIERKPHA
jgi:hypothetical protein